MELGILRGFSEDVKIFNSGLKFHPPFFVLDLVFGQPHAAAEFFMGNVLKRCTHIRRNVPPSKILFPTYSTHHSLHRICGQKPALFGSRREKYEDAINLEASFWATSDGSRKQYDFPER